MSDLRHYAVDVERNLEPPALSDLVEVARSRRRVRALTVTAASVAVAVIAAVAGWGGVTGTERGATPAHLPPGPSGSAGVQFLSGEEIADDPSAAVLYSIDATDSWARMRDLPASDRDGRVLVWYRCSSAPSDVHPTDCLHSGVFALEVQSDHGADSLFVRVDAIPDPGNIVYVGHGTFSLTGTSRIPDVLLRAGTSEPVSLGVSPVSVPPRPALEVVPCRDATGGGSMCTIDVGRRLLTRVELPSSEGSRWSRQTTGGFWGIAGGEGPGSDGSDRPLVQADDGRFEERSFEPAAQSLILPLGVPDGVIGYFSDGGAWRNLPVIRYLHVSSDRGMTWRTLTVPENVEGSLDPGGHYVTLVPLLPDGWESWPEATVG